MAEDPQGIANPSIDMNGYLAVASAAAAHRESHRLSEEEFLHLARMPGTILLDARSREKYDQLHLAGAINLSFPDIAVETLRHTIPDRSTRILIYCNNNFINATGPFPTKLADGLSQSVDLHRALLVRLSQCLGACAAGRSHRFAARIRGNHAAKNRTRNPHRLLNRGS